MSLAILDGALRGATCVLVLLLAVVLLRDHGRERAARLGAAFALGTAAYAITSAPGFDRIAGTWSLPLLALSAGNNVVFWIFSAALFEDDFRPRWWHGGLWLVMVAAGLWFCVAPSRPLGMALTLSSLGFAVLVMAQAFVSWRVDLVERRRRVRAFVVVASSLFIGATALAQLAGVHNGAPGPGSLAGALGLLAIAGAAAVSLVRINPDSLLTPQRTVPAPAPTPLADDADQPLLATLGRLMTSERAYRQEGLTIATLAGQVGVPEYRLRRLINQRLGHRNFNSFVNHYRIAEAKAALADPRQEAVPVLTIALDAGFSSLGPFNRAFKAETGLTPTDFRRQNLGNSGIGEPIPESASRISNPASREITAP
jgi:AraC-like DNA-binding protein